MLVFLIITIILGFFNIIRIGRFILRKTQRKGFRSLFIDLKG